jgi:hypothetical protein
MFVRFLRFSRTTPRFFVFGFVFVQGLGWNGGGS